ncbi:pyrimidine dimer DNA glycosylase/endonuclease V [Aneurinibacillus uraniidurans]|uniref:pyrimidine dimer DNA glycosylase/endonuclease V n=1 Tax=Aneurinibacillus uraniidurans TaxID=2966586 RepID=UPI00234B8883|nr:pyrimidine dimer DNA glycosylase/endonuclease V [Aneurinibacillus sp. B1]WCN36558.1 pyrimidine dimer DNA glycosylase/endonuclease V [Aneurinibacillus sp. B1]
MQIFRPFKCYDQSARFLCDSRLNKQVLECYQVAKSILVHMTIMEGRGGYFRHPITQHVYNNGRPYLPSLYQFMEACNREWLRRGKNRGSEFAAKIENLRLIVIKHHDQFSWEYLPPFYCYGDDRVYHEEQVYQLYRKLLKQKWGTDKIIPKCSIILKHTNT